MKIGLGKKLKYNNHRKLKICLAFSPGGHSIEAMQLLPALSDHMLVYAAPYAVTTKHLRNLYALKDPSRDGTVKALLSDIAIALKIIVAELPDVIITTGAQIVIPLCYLSKIIIGAKIIYVETFARMNAPSFTGRVIFPIADVFLVQWKSLLKFYGSKAKYVGTVF